MTRAWSPWGQVPLRTNQAAPGAEFGDLSSAAYSIPFLAFDIEPLRCGPTHETQGIREGVPCQEKEFPSSEKEFPRMR